MSNTVAARGIKKGKEPFDLDAVIDDADNAPYVFMFKGREWVLPHLNDLDIWPMLEAYEKGSMAAMRAVLETAFGDDWKEFRSHKIPRHAITELFERYSKHSGIKPGELPASTD